MTTKATAQAKAIASLKDVVAKGKALEITAQQNRKDILAAVLALKSDGLQAQWDFVGQKLMPIMLSRFTGAEIKQTRNGTYFFCVKGTDATREQAAQSFLRQRLSLTTLLSGSGTTNKAKRADPAATFTRAVKAAHEAGLSRSKLLALIEMAL